MSSFDEALRRRDITSTPAYNDAAAFHRAYHAPAFGRCSFASAVSVSRGGEHIAFVGHHFDDLLGEGASRLYVLDVGSDRVWPLTASAHCDRAPVFAPDASGALAFLSDRKQPGRFQIYLSTLSGMIAPRSLGELAGSVERLGFSPDGRRVFAIHAAAGAPGTTAEGAQSNFRSPSEELWSPRVHDSAQRQPVRRLSVFTFETGNWRMLSCDGNSIWNACWLGNAFLAAVVSEGGDESAWYGAHLVSLDVETGAMRTLYRPRRMIGAMSASPDGRRIALIDSLASDRGIQAGEPVLIDCAAEPRRVPLPTLEMDVSDLDWSEDCLVVAGLQGPKTVVADVFVEVGEVRRRWVSDTTTLGVLTPTIAVSSHGQVIALEDGYRTPPRLIEINRGGRVRTRIDFGHPGSNLLLEQIGDMRAVEWRAKDNLNITGWIIEPHGRGPFPTLVDVHGGPVWATRNQWLARSRIDAPYLAARGFAVFLPNFRGSLGAGCAFQEKILGDMGGADAQDVLSGVDALVREGVADPARLAIGGGSYGGFAACWIPTLDNRFRAAIAVSPVTDWYAQNRLSNIAAFDELFLGERPRIGGAHAARSPILHVRKNRTPTLLIGGAEDHATPAEQILGFATALREAGGEALALIYPGEGHGVRKLPAAIDVGARSLAWLKHHLDIVGAQ